jgi:hypothetical protein
MNGFDRLVRTVGAVLCGLVAISIVGANTALAAYIKVKNGYVTKLDSKGVQAARLDYILETVDVPEGATIPKNKSLTVGYSKSRLGELAYKAKNKNALSIAVNLAIIGAGYAIDELTNQVTHLAPDPDSGYQEGYVWGTRWRPRYATPAEAFPHMFPGFPDSTIYHVHSVTDCGYSGKYYECRVEGTATFDGHVHDVGTEVVRGACTDCPEVPKIVVPVESDEVWDIVGEKVASGDRSTADEAFKDKFGRPIMTPELADAIEQWGREVADGDPNLSWDDANKRWIYVDPGTGVVTEGRPLDPVNDDPMSDTSNDPVSDVSLPAFCSWATIVCDWYQWMTAEPEIPEPGNVPFQKLTVDEVRQDFDSGLGAGSCPAPRSISYNGWDGQYSFDTACMAAETYFRPVLLAMAGIMAAFIIVGASRRA